MLYACTRCGTISDERRCAAHRQPVRGPSSYLTSSRRWKEHIRPTVIARDKGICWLCGEPGADTADHVKPVSKGGTNALENLKAAHRCCNQQRGAD